MSKVVATQQAGFGSWGGPRLTFRGEWQMARLVEAAMAERFGGSWTAVAGGQAARDWNWRVAGQGFAEPTDEEAVCADEIIERLCADDAHADWWAEPGVKSITVGGEAHCVQDDDGNLVREIMATEPCDSCGSTRDDSCQAPFVLGASGGTPLYMCSNCGAEYQIGRTAEAETAF